jgi:hypothetical protein
MSSAAEDMNAKTKALFTTVAESQGVQIAQLEEQLGRLNVALGSLETKVEGDMQGEQQEFVEGELVGRVAELEGLKQSSFAAGDFEACARHREAQMLLLSRARREDAARTAAASSSGGGSELDLAAECLVNRGGEDLAAQLDVQVKSALYEAEALTELRKEVQADLDRQGEMERAMEATASERATLDAVAELEALKQRLLGGGALEEFADPVHYSAATQRLVASAGAGAGAGAGGAQAEAMDAEMVEVAARLDGADATAAVMASMEAEMAAMDAEMANMAAALAAAKAQSAELLGMKDSLQAEIDDAVGGVGAEEQLLN